MSTGGWQWDSEGEGVCSARAYGVADAPQVALERWYAVQTRARHEKKVAARLESCGVHTYLPLVSELHRWSDRRKLVEVPLFPGYAFIRAADYAHAAVRVMRTDGVVTIVGSGPDGGWIPNEEIEAVRRVLAQELPFATQPFLKIGQRVRIRGGALDGIEGILLARTGERKLVISVEMIQRSLAIRIDGFDVEAA